MREFEHYKALYKLVEQYVKMRDAENIYYELDDLDDSDDGDNNHVASRPQRSTVRRPVPSESRVVSYYVQEDENASQEEVVMIYNPDDVVRVGNSSRGTQDHVVSYYADAPGEK